MNAPSPDQPQAQTRALAERAVPDARIERHLVQAYAKPLRAYYRTTPWYRVYGRDPDWQPEVVVRDFLKTLAHTHVSGQTAEAGPAPPLRARLVADLRRALRDRRRTHRLRLRGG